MLNYFVKQPKLLCYTFVFIIMMTLFVSFPFWEKYIYLYVQDQINISSLEGLKSDSLHEIMNIIPLFYISILGLSISMINTAIFCFVGKKSTLKSILSIISLFIWFYIGYRIGVFFQFKLTDSIYVIYNSFSEFVERITIGSILLFFVIDVIDLFRFRKFSSWHQCILMENRPKSLAWKYSWLQLLLIDIPITVVTVVIIIYNKYLDESLLTLDVSKGHVFRNTFSAGAWGIQIIYSQMVFYFLMLSCYHEEWIFDKHKKKDKC